MDGETIVRRRTAEERAGRQGHVLGPWQALYPARGGSVAFVAACGACGLTAFAHRYLAEYGEAARTACAAGVGKADAAIPSPEELPIVA